MMQSSALKALPDANLTIISIPGKYAAIEARKAIKNNLNVLLFSSNVSLADEIKLKKMALKKGLLVMGPDCGTVIINNIALGFANVVKSGVVGIVGSSGTGIQEVSTLIDRGGYGISHAIGTGSRDMSKEVGGLSMLQGIEMLDRDKKTKIIILISKPPAREVVHKVLQKAKKSKKPIIVNFIGADLNTVPKNGLIPASTLEEAAYKAIDLITQKSPHKKEYKSNHSEGKFTINAEIQKLNPGQKYIRGLYAGGTLCYEAILILRDTLGDIHSNAPLKRTLKLTDPWTSNRNTIVDLGSEEFVEGRLHPMIDPTIRNQRIIQEAKDPTVAVLLLDIILGYGAHPDPAGALIESIIKAKNLAKKHERYLPVVTSVCGTKQDPQNLILQEKKLRNAGVVVMPTNAEASRIAGLIVSRCQIDKK
jgi:succinyl-CoA synthetase alpha subunit